ncbi:UDP-N-acetyl glucosamine 2-epimerase [Holdemania massiliensis]|uniref:UDP-N-acetyl glucosamine 2-epimerase n=1 Tax=Holdemania massiliensis TaxID=1468449 RepID=UPI003566A20B
MEINEISVSNSGKLEVLIIVDTRPEIIRLSAVISRCREYFYTVLTHTDQYYHYNLSSVFFKALNIVGPDVYLNCVGDGLSFTVGNIVAFSYNLMKMIKPDALLILRDINSFLSAISAKRLHIPIFHMEAGNRCKDESLPKGKIVDIIRDVNLVYSEPAQKYLHECGIPKERVYVTGLPMAEVLTNYLDKIFASNILESLQFQKKKYILLSAHKEENIDTDENFYSLFHAINFLATNYEMPILYSCLPRSKKKLLSSNFKLDNRVILHEPLGFYDSKKNINEVKQQFLLLDDYNVPLFNY